MMCGTSPPRPAPSPRVVGDYAGRKVRKVRSLRSLHKLLTMVAK